ncbi:hypothetical protein QYF61_003289, partial [Mycteria americana]
MKKKKGEKKKKTTKLFYCKGGQTLAQAAQRGCRVSILGDTENLTGHNPGQPAITSERINNELILPFRDDRLCRMLRFEGAIQTGIQENPI